MVELINVSQKTHLKRLFGVVSNGQTYLNVIYLLLAFPLGLVYFVFLVTGLSLGIGLIIIGIGIPILLLMMTSWWGLASFERKITIWLLRVEDIPPMLTKTKSRKGIWERFGYYLSNPVTWKSLVYLCARFPLGLLSFIVSVILISLTTGMVAAPVIYESHTLNVGFWQVDTLGEALICSILGVGVGLISIHVMNSLAFVSGRFASLMLGPALHSSPK